MRTLPRNLPLSSITNFPKGITAFVGLFNYY